MTSLSSPDILSAMVERTQTFPPEEMVGMISEADADGMQIAEHRLEDDGSIWKHFSYYGSPGVLYEINTQMGLEDFGLQRSQLGTPATAENPEEIIITVEPFAITHEIKSQYPEPQWHGPSPTRTISFASKVIVGNEQITAFSWTQDGVTGTGFLTPEGQIVSERKVRYGGLLSEEPMDIHISPDILRRDGLTLHTTFVE